MLNINGLTKVNEGIQSNLKKMQELIGPAEKEIQELTKRDGDIYTQEHINKKIIEKRTEISDKLYPLFGEINAAANEAAKSKKFYDSNTFMLSRVKLNDDNVIESQMRMAKLLEFSAMDSGELQMVAEAAWQSKKFAEIWLAHLASRQKSDKPGQQVNLDGIKTDEQEQGLDLLKKIGQGQAAAELLMRGGVIAPFQRKISASERLNIQTRAGLLDQQK